MRPAAHLLFLTRQEKKAKEGDPTGRVPIALRWGNLRCSIGRWRCRTRFAAAQRRSNNCSESEHEARASSGARAHRPLCASRHVQRGAKTNRAIAVLGPQRRRRFAPRKSGPSAAMARVAVQRPLRLRLRRGSGGVGRRTHFAALQRRSDNRGQSEHEAAACCAAAATPPEPRRRRSLKG